MAQPGNKPNKEEKKEKLKQDYETPFSEPDDIPRSRVLPPDHPLLDSNLDEDEWYSEGRDAAAGNTQAPKRKRLKT